MPSKAEIKRKRNNGAWDKKGKRAKYHYSAGCGKGFTICES
jgi:hypothetical protein